MRYISTRKNKESVSFKDAVVNGLSENGGLYFPETVPTLPDSFFKNITSLSDHEIAFEVLMPYVDGSLNEDQLKHIIQDAISFPTPLHKVTDSIYSLELFHGPTQAFKDVGARFMARCLSHFDLYAEKKTIILVATSGDTGSAVASGFFKVPNVEVVILFPKGKVSPYQEYQMTSLGENIRAIEVEGAFDDCQKLVKTAFGDNSLRDEINLSSANSINVARLLPQMLYYFFSYKSLQSQLKGKEVTYSVPSGNLGNITAGLIAQKMGLPIHHFIAALNANDTFLKYLSSGAYKMQPSKVTLSNAMDVGNPSNFERIAHLYDHDLLKTREHITAYSYDDKTTLEKIKTCQDHLGYLLDPHGAVGLLALETHLKEGDIGVFLETAHPQKFSEVIKRVIPEYESVDVDLSLCQKSSINNNYKRLKEVLLS